MPTLKSTTPAGLPQVFSIYKKITSIGRATSNDVVLDIPSANDNEAQIVFDGRDFNIHAAEERGEIQVNGKKKRRSKIFHNDEILIGEVELVFSVYDEAQLDQDSS